MTHYTDEQRQSIEAIAAALAADWRVEEDNWLRLASPDLTLNCHFEGYGAQAGRLSLSLEGDGLHQYRRHGQAWPEISVDPKRPAVALAKDIERRLLREARPLLAELRQRKAEVGAYQERRAALLTELAGILGTDVNREQVRFDRQGLWATIVSSSDKRVTIEVRGVPAELARRVCRLLVGEEG